MSGASGPLPAMSGGSSITSSPSAPEPPKAAPPRVDTPPPAPTTPRESTTALTPQQAMELAQELLIPLLAERGDEDGRLLGGLDAEPEPVDLERVVAAAHLLPGGRSDDHEHRYLLPEQMEPLLVDTTATPRPPRNTISSDTSYQSDSEKPKIAAMNAQDPKK